MHMFQLRRADDVDAAINAASAAQTAQQGADIRFLAGGTTLIDLMKLNVETPQQVIDINHLPLDKIEPTADGGLKIVVDIHGGLSDGLHGFHVHQNPSCAPAQTDGKAVAAAAAGGHFDSQKTGHHMGPSGEGHMGDLPVISVTGGMAMNQVLWAPRLTLAEVRGRALMIHAGGDNYRDNPQPLGGGGGRAACGVVPA